MNPQTVVLPGRKESLLLVQQIKRPPARRLAEALIVQFPDIEIKLRDDGYTAGAMLNGVAVLLCEQYRTDRDGREGWWTMMDHMFPRLVAFLSETRPVPEAAPAPADEVANDPHHG